MENEEIKEVIKKGLTDGLKPVLDMIKNHQEILDVLIKDVKKNDKIIELLDQDRKVTNELIEIENLITENENKKGSEIYI